MKKLIYFLIVPFLFISCEKYSGGDSISGSWSCTEERGVRIKQYSVLIGRAGVGFDTTYFIINNFHNLGYEHETYVQLKDTTITLRFMDGYSVVGKGHVTRDLKAIEWNYSISGSGTSESYVVAFFRKK